MGLGLILLSFISTVIVTIIHVIIVSAVKRQREAADAERWRRR